MKKLLLVLLFSTIAPGVFAAEEECPPAAEMAEAQNHNLYKHCNYSDEGINGVLHRALAKKKVQAEEVSEAEMKTPKVRSDAVTNKQATSPEAPLQLGEFKTAAQLQSAKITLLENLSRECQKGFVVEGERYVPDAKSKNLRLELIYHCL